MKSPIIFSFLFASLLNFAAHSVEKTSTYVGFWEKEGLRKVFEYNDLQWKSSLVEIKTKEELKTAASHYSFPLEWTLYFDGKTYGTLSTKIFGKYSFYHENGLQKPAGSEPDLPFRKDQSLFADWMGKIPRPVLAFSEMTLTDPNNWRPSKNGKILPFILKDLKNKMKAKVFFCKTESCEDDKPQRMLKDSEFVGLKSYKDRVGNELISIKLRFSPDTFAYCQVVGDSCQNEGPFWYLAKASGEVQFVTNGTALIETADLNNDGTSEWVFWLDEYNQNGYVLVDGKALKAYKSTWRFH